MGDELFDPDKFLVTFPLWFLNHPKVGLKGLVGLNGPHGEKAPPLFTDKDLAERFMASAPPLAHYVLEKIADPRALLVFLDSLKTGGFTHVTFDHVGGRAAFTPIPEFRAYTERAMRPPDGPSPADEGA
jgi:hypothetical protein